MEQTVYIDLYFLINFSMDFLCFFLVSKLLSYPFSWLRSIGAAAFGGAYACVALVLSVEGIGGLLLDLGAWAIMSFIAQKKKGNLKETAIYALVFTATSIVLGGFMTVLFSFFNRLELHKLFGDDESASDGVSVWLFALLAATSGLLSVLGGRFFRKKSSRREGRVRLSFEGSQIELGAFCDSGNLLREPISGKMCVVVSAKDLESVLPEQIKKIIDGAPMPEDIGKLGGKIRVVPTSSVGGESILYALRPDKLSINMGRGWSAVDAYIVLGNLTAMPQGAEALVPSELVSGLP